MSTINSLKQLGLFSLCSLLMLSSCTRPEDGTGLDLIPGEDLLFANQTDTFTLDVITEVTDSVFLDERATLLLGNMFDPVFGQTRASIYTQFSPLTLNPDFPSNFAVDSVVLSLSYFGNAWGNQAPQTFRVLEVNEEFYLDSAYTRTKNFATTGGTLVDELAPIAWRGVKLDPDTDVPVGEDTLSPQLRIRLKKAFGERILTADPNALSSSAEFKEYFKGLYITSPDYNGGICDIDPLNSNTKIRIYYRDFTNTETDTTFYDLVVTSGEARVNNITRDYTGTAMAALTPDTPIDGSEYCYTETVGGTRVKIHVPHLKELNKLSGRIINRAELLIPYTDDETYVRPSFVFGQYRNDSRKLISIPDYASGVIAASGVAQNDPDRYKINISRYVQFILNGSIANDTLYLIGLESGISPKRAYLHGPQFPGERQERMRLVVTFTE